MKRKGNIYQQFCSMENLIAAEAVARKGKSKQYGVIAFDKRRKENFIKLQEMLVNKTFTTSQYTNFKIFDPKERDVSRLPYFPDRIVHHAAMRLLEPLFVSSFITNTFSCIKGRGIHAGVRAVKKALKNVPGTTYCLKLDVKKFYPNIDHRILKRLLRRKIKDEYFLSLLDEIIDSAPRVPIGNYLSQYFANFYLTYFDHWIKETKRVKYYFRYADDLVILSDSKEYLHQLLKDIQEYFSVHLNLTVKSNYQVFPVAARGIDFLGYVFYHTHTRLRKSIKQRYARKVAKGINNKSKAAYKGWTKHCNANHLNKKLAA